MGTKDITEKYLAAYNDVFADILNVLLFKGKQVVKPDSLETDGCKTVYKADGKPHEQERDIAKIWKEQNIKIALFGLENQTVIENYMPLRAIGYDGASYRTQLLSKGEKYPVVTIVLHFGTEKKWDGPKRLLECFQIPKELKSYVNDYKINVFDIAFLEDKQVQQFNSDFRIVADYFVQKRKNKNYKPKKEIIKHVDAVLKLMSVLTNDSRFEEIQLTKGADITMCDVLDKVEEKGRLKGRKEGRMEGRMEEIFLSVQEYDYSIDRGAEKAGLTRDEFIEKMKEAGYKLPV